MAEKARWWGSDAPACRVAFAEELLKLDPQARMCPARFVQVWDNRLHGFGSKCRALPFDKEWQAVDPGEESLKNTNTWFFKAAVRALPVQDMDFAKHEGLAAPLIVRNPGRGLTVFYWGKADPAAPKAATVLNRPLMMPGTWVSPNAASRYPGQPWEGTKLFYMVRGQYVDLPRPVRGMRWQPLEIGEED